MTNEEDGMRSDSERLLRAFAESWVTGLSQKYPKHSMNLTRDDWDVLTAFADFVTKKQKQEAKKSEKK